MIAILIAIAAQVASDPAASAADRQGELAKSDAEAIIARCGARKFETEVTSNNAGKVRKAKILLCAKAGDSDAQWIATLEKSAAQLEASPQLSAEAKSKVLGEIQAAIAQVRGQQQAQP